MANFYGGTIQKGSGSTDDIKKWQTYLNTQGHNLTVDGIFGDNTDAATRAYQEANGLTVDGIVGVNTWTKAGFSNMNNPTSAPTSTPYEREEFNLSDETNAKKGVADDLSNQYLNHEGISVDRTSLDDIISKILNREEFSYDLNGDALYQQYKDKYIQQGKMAMQDTMGQASAMTGGYGNSYAATVGNQAYQASLENLNDIVPELYQMAYDRYNQEGQDLYNQYGLLSDDYSRQYNEQMDAYNMLGEKAAYANSDYWNSYNAENSNYWNNENFNYGVHRDGIEDAQWKAQFDESVRQHEQGMALTKEQWDWQKGQYSSSGSSSGGSSGGGSGGSGGSGSGNGGYSNQLGVSDDIIAKCEGIKSNTELGSYIDGLEAAGVITAEQGTALYAKYCDDNEKIITNDDGSFKSYSFKDMCKSTNGWEVLDDGGGNLLGIDRDARVRAPNGEEMSLLSLRKKLQSEGMGLSEANKLIKKLQQNLGISSNWLFGW